MIQIQYGPSGPVLRLKDQDLGPVWSPDRKKVPRLNEDELFKLACWGERSWPWRKQELHRLYFWARGLDCPAGYVEIGTALGRAENQLYLLGRPVKAAEALNRWPVTQLGLEDPPAIYRRLLHQKMHGSTWEESWHIENLGDLAISTTSWQTQIHNARSGELLFVSHEDQLPRPALKKWLRTARWGRLQMLSEHLFGRLLVWKLRPDFPVRHTAEDIAFWWEGQEPRILVTESEGDFWLLTSGRAVQLSRQNLPDLLAKGLLAPHNPTAPFWVQAVSGLELEPPFTRASRAWLLPDALCLKEGFDTFHFLEPGIAGNWVDMEPDLTRGLLPRLVEEAGMDPTSMCRCFDFRERFYLGQVHGAEIHLYYDPTPWEEMAELWVYQENARQRPSLRGEAQTILARIEHEGLEQVLAIHQLASI
jgi:hypothetical protein